MLNRLTDPLKRLAGKIVGALHNVDGEVVSTILRFVNKAVGLYDQQTIQVFRQMLFGVIIKEYLREVFEVTPTHITQTAEEILSELSQSQGSTV